MRNIGNHTGTYNDTGFNWKKIDVIGSKNPSLDESSVDHAWRSQVNKSTKHRVRPTADLLYDMVKDPELNVPVKQKVVTSSEFERIAAMQAKRDGKPLIEKTIFIVKPIYVPIGVKSEPQSEKPINTKKRNKVKSKAQKAIYMERPKAPNYMNANATALNEKPRKQGKRKRTLSPSPIRYQIGGKQYEMALN